MTLRLVSRERIATWQRGPEIVAAIDAGRCCIKPLVVRAGVPLWCARQVVQWAHQAGLYWPGQTEEGGVAAPTARPLR